jgi:hypothetical protein
MYFYVSGMIPIQKCPLNSRQPEAEHHETSHLQLTIALRFSLTSSRRPCGGICLVIFTFFYCRQQCPDFPSLRPVYLSTTFALQGRLLDDFIILSCLALALVRLLDRLTLLGLPSSHVDCHKFEGLGTVEAESAFLQGLSKLERLRPLS